MDVSKEINGDYECILNGKSLLKYRLTVEHEECVKPRSLAAYMSCQREWCKQADGYRVAMQEWRDTKKKNVGSYTIRLFHVS
uniref:Ig-like domain-containing protein n=1 Tax=Heterorhabditis bacteriophora TaxID=37862 RepID=A0A1I7WYJ5_HETBA